MSLRQNVSELCAKELDPSPPPYECLPGTATGPGLARAPSPGRRSTPSAQPRPPSTISSAAALTTPRGWRSKPPTRGRSRRHRCGGAAGMVRPATAAAVAGLGPRRVAPRSARPDPPPHCLAPRLPCSAAGWSRTSGYPLRLERLLSFCP